jgi:tryptophan synthase alpha chain
MKNRLIELFERKKERVLNIYFTAGYPNLNDTVQIAKYLEEAGADILEIGMPYSDPMADGPTIQQSSELALENGMSIKVLLQQLKDIRQKVSIPICLMGYINPVMQYGIEKFCSDIAAIGIDALILPDLPYLEYKELYQSTFEKHNLSNIFLVTPQTTPERLKAIDEVSSGFIYIVSTNSTTGNASKGIADKSIASSVPYFERIKNSGLKNPTLIGFNIKDNESFELASSYSNGAIIGSAFINLLKDSKNLEVDIKEYIKHVKG